MEFGLYIHIKKYPSSIETSRYFKAHEFSLNDKVKIMRSEFHHWSIVHQQLLKQRVLVTGDHMTFSTARPTTQTRRAAKFHHDEGGKHLKKHNET